MVKEYQYFRSDPRTPITPICDLLTAILKDDIGDKENARAGRKEIFEARKKGCLR